MASSAEPREVSASALTGNKAACVASVDGLLFGMLERRLTCSLVAFLVAG